MSTDRLRSLLEKHGEKSFRIERLIYIKLEALAIEDPARANEKDPRTIDPSYVKQLSEKIVKAISAHPNISGPTPLSTSGNEMMSLNTPRFVFSVDHLLFRVMLPKHQLKYGVWGSGKDVEEFYAIYTGSLFAAFRETNNFPEPSSIGQELRELLTSQIEKESSLQVSAVPPCPMHPNFYLLIGQSLEGGGPDRHPNVFSENGNLFIVINTTSTKTETLVDNLLSDIEHQILVFYNALCTQHRINDVAHEALGDFTTLSQFAKDLFATPGWNIVKARRLIKAIRIRLSTIHELLVEREASVVYSHGSVENLLETIADHPLLSEIKDYFRKTLAEITQIPESLTPALNYYENELNLALNIRSLIVATIVGAVVGAVIASLLTWLLGH
jgi:hypothetical protein